MKETPTNISLQINSIEPNNENQFDITTASENSIQGKGRLISSINIQIARSDFDVKTAQGSYRNIKSKKKTNKIGNIYAFICYRGNFIITIGPQCTLLFL